MAAERQSTRRGGRGVSIAFGALALVLAALAIVLALNEEERREPTPPPAPPGDNQFVHVEQALEREGLAVEYQQSGGLTAGELGVPGQPMTVDGHPLYVFIFRSGDAVASAQAAASAADPAAVLPAGSGTPSSDASPRLFAQSNVVVALDGGEAEVADKVARAIEGLP